MRKNRKYNLKLYLKHLTYLLKVSIFIELKHTLINRLFHNLFLALDQQK